MSSVELQNFLSFLVAFSGLWLAWDLFKSLKKKEQKSFKVFLPPDGVGIPKNIKPGVLVFATQPQEGISGVFVYRWEEGYGLLPESVIPTGDAGVFIGWFEPPVKKDDSSLAWAVILHGGRSVITRADHWRTTIY
jgi:hypothetical protein